MNAAGERRLTRPLAAAALLLGVLLLGLFAGLGRAVYWAPPRPVPPLPAANTAAALPAPVPLEQFAAVWQHPLFSPDRKPSVHAAGNNSNLGAMQLTGIILTRDLRMALLHDKKSGQEVRVHEGDALPDGSWTLTQVRARSALFDSASGRAELKLPAGARIDNARSPGKAAAGDQQDGAAAPGAANTWTTNGQGGEVKPEQPPGADQGNTDQDNPDQGNQDQDNPAAGATDQGQGNPAELAPASEQNAPAAEPPAPASSQGDRLQAERIRHLRETILKRRAAQAAAAAHEGDH